MSCLENTSFAAATNSDALISTLNSERCKITSVNCQMSNL
jgi:hypothetical protein